MKRQPDMTLPRISKSKFVAGSQCHLRLWLTVNEPEADELEPNAMLRALFARGTRIGERAREDFLGGVLIELDPRRKAEAIEATVQAMASDAVAILEACFEEDGVFVAVDALERTAQGWNLIEVKSSGKVKAAHLPDVAVQAHVLRAAGLTIERVELMHVNNDNRYPDVSDLFTRADLTAEASERAAALPAEIEAQRACLAGPEPAIEPGEHCSTPADCPFMSRCWPTGPEHPVTDLHYLGRKLKADFASRGLEAIPDIPADYDLSAKHRRHVNAVQGDALVVESGLGAVLGAWESPIAYLDFESSSPFPPAWPGCGPSTAMPVQWSLHRRRADGTVDHVAWLAEGPEDPRPALARALVDACKEARVVLTYSGYEMGMVNKLQVAVPELKDELEDLKSRFVDLLPVVRENVYHPDFHGSFGIKTTLPALVSGLGYDDLEVADGFTASMLLENMMLHPECLDGKDPAELRRELLAYCERDTLAMVKLHERLEELSAGPPEPSATPR